MVEYCVRNEGKSIMYTAHANLSHSEQIREPIEISRNNLQMNKMYPTSRISAKFTTKSCPEVGGGPTYTQVNKLVSCLADLLFLSCHVVSHIYGLIL